MNNSSPPTQPGRPSGPPNRPGERTQPPTGPRPKIPPPTKPTKGEAERLYTIPEVAELWGCTRQHVYEVIATGELATTDISTKGAKRSKTRVPASALDEFATQRMRPARRPRRAA